MTPSAMAKAAPLRPVQQTAAADTAGIPPRRSSLLYRMLKRLRHPFSAAIARCSLVGNEPLHDPATFHWIRGLEQSYPAIRPELEVVLQFYDGIPPIADISPDNRSIAPQRKWKSLFL